MGNLQAHSRKFGKGPWSRRGDREKDAEEEGKRVKMVKGSPSRGRRKPVAKNGGGLREKEVLGEGRESIELQEEVENSESRGRMAWKYPGAQMDSRLGRAPGAESVEF